MRPVYLDNNATTRPAPEVVQAMLPYLTERFHNPSSPYPQADAVADALREARGRVARLLGAFRADEVTFTSGGTEAIQTAFAAAAAAAGTRRWVVTSTVEHSATRAAARELEARGMRWIQVPVDDEGRLDREALFAAIGGDTALVSLLAANNETGVRFDLEGVGAACRAAGAPLHLDLVQLPGKAPIDVSELGCDLASLAAHKFHGPKGVGALWVRGEQAFTPLIVGGPQERERRAGTENVPGAVGMGRAAELARTLAEDPDELAALGARRDRFERGVLERFEGATINGAGAPRVPSTTSITFPEHDADTLLMVLGAAGVMASAGSACDARRRGPSPVLLAMGRDEGEASRTLRFSLSHDTTDEDVTCALEAIEASVAALGLLE